MSARTIVFDLAGRKRFETASRLCLRKNWKPICWIGSLEEQGGYIRERFPEVLYATKKTAIKKQVLGSISAEWVCRDSIAINRLAKYDPILFPVFLRETSRLYGMDQLAEYYQAITYWYNFFQHFKPELVLFGHIPAHVYDYLTYLLCKEEEIPTLFLMRHHHVPGIIMPTNSFEEPPPRIKEKYVTISNTLQVSDLSLTNDWRAFKKKMSGDYKDVAYKSFSERYVITENDYIKLKYNILRKIKDILTGKKSIYYARALVREVVTIHRRWILRRFYNKKAETPNYENPYIFMPLHVQPERTSVPGGGIFAHQLLLIELLSRSLPEGWCLYVKEHPVQLYDRPVFKLFRTPQFYKDILEFDNVKLVPSNITSFKLIKNAKAVAGVTSTTCWEALFQNVPVMTCGSVWYEFCDGVFPVDDLSSVKRAIVEIKNGLNANDDSTHKLLYSIQQEGISKPPSYWLCDTDLRKKEWECWIDQLDRQIDADGYIVPL